MLSRDDFYMDIHSSENIGNKLKNESSPYLLQHASNPVNWYPWGPAAIELARKQDKPILLSIGYSACHWCHVMMHKVFMDPDVASTMNRLFINIKVDKEERPDLDKIYQTAHQLLMGKAGGWPLTMFLTPDTLIPYYGGTYFEQDFQPLLHRLNEVYYHEKEKIKQQELHTLAILQVIMQPLPPSDLPLAINLRTEAETVMRQEFDPVNSGFGNEAKFPNCPSLEFLLHSTDLMIRHIALTTLLTMAQRGIYDQLAGGFFRYTVDEKWQIPHFEKMLYDNAQLLGLYASAYKYSHNQDYKQIALETGAWLSNCMRDPINGGFYTSIDADSEEQEGIYYVWDVAEIKATLTAEEFASIKKYYHLDHKPNFDDNWHLITNTECNSPDTEQLKIIKHKLLTQRELRIKPNIDTKILTAWNGLVIKGLSIAGQLLNHQQFLDLAAGTIDFIANKLFIDNILYATFQDNTAKIPGFLDDYAFAIDGILTFINNDAQHKYIGLCTSLADSLISNFYDTEAGGFFFTAHSSEQLFYRPKVFTDDATPSGSGIACLALIKLGKLVKNEHYIEVAKKSIYAGQAFLNEAPELHLSMCEAYELLHSANDISSFPQKL